MTAMHDLVSSSGLSAGHKELWADIFEFFHDQPEVFAPLEEFLSAHPDKLAPVTEVIAKKKDIFLSGTTDGFEHIIEEESTLFT